VLKLQDQLKPLLQNMKLLKLVKNMKGITASVALTALIKGVSSVRHV